MRSLRWFMLGLVCVALVACQDEKPSTTQTSAPTFTLIPASPTPTPLQTPVPMPSASAFNPSDLPTYTPVPNTLLSEDATRAIEAVLNQYDGEIVNLKAVPMGTSAGLRCSNFRGTATAYRVVLRTETTLTVYVATAEGEVLRCPNASPFITQGTPLAFDPIGESLVDVAVRDLANTLAIDETSIEWRDLSIIEWRDTSLGCPSEDGNYAFVLIDGYRIVLQVDDQEYIYHADGIEARFCPAERELLPPPFVTPTPLPSPEATPE